MSNTPPASAVDPLSMYRRAGGVFGKDFCSSPHPDKPFTFCRRMPHTDGDHAAFTHLISAPETWPMTASEEADA